MKVERVLKCVPLPLALAALVALPLLLWATPAQGSAPPPSPPERTAPFVERQILLKAQAGVSSSEVAQAVGATVQRGIGDGSIHLLMLKDGSVGDAVQILRAMPGVVFAEPNWLRQLHGPNDPDYGLKWDLNNDGHLCDGSDCATADADMDWEEAYTLLGSGFNGPAVIAVIDTGADLAHPDLDGNLVSGYDFLDNDPNPTDTYGHGTHVAGIAAAETNNSTGTAGVAYGANIEIMPLRVCDENGCPTSAIVDAIYYAADNGANVINLSLGGKIGSSSEEQAINYAWNKGLVIAASSGNDGAGRVSYPAAFANCIAVGSTNWHDLLAPYSNKGKDLDVVAPGGDMDKYDDPGGIYSTMPTYDVFLTTAYSYDKFYDQLQGTSMAAPQVSGLAALLFAMGVTDADGDGKINDEIRDIIESTADDLGRPGWDREYGWGRINVYNAVAGGPPPPPPPEGKMHVSAIVMSYVKRGPNYFVYTRVTIVDESDSPVSDATVYLTTTLPDGSTVSDSGATGSDGTVTFSVKSQQTGTYTSEVTDVTHASLTYDPAANVETSESLTVP